MNHTIYSNYSDLQLYSLFRAENWHSPNMDEFQRQQALQELVDRDSMKNGIASVPVEVSDQVGSFGVYRPGSNSIGFNEGYVNRGYYEYNRTGMPVAAPNLRVMSTAFHENTHSFQRQSEANPDLYADNPQMARDVAANQYGYNYIPSRGEYTDYNLYRIQVLEREAFRIGAEKTAAAMKSLEPYYGKPDPNMAQFEGLAERQYQESLRNAQLRYNDPNIQQTLQRAMNDNAFQNREIPKDLQSSYYEVRAMIAKNEIEMRQSQMEGPDVPQYEKDLHSRIIQERQQELRDLEQANKNSLANMNQANPELAAPDLEQSETDALHPEAAPAPDEEEQLAPGMGEADVSNEYHAGFSDENEIASAAENEAETVGSGMSESNDESENDDEMGMEM